MPNTILLRLKDEPFILEGLLVDQSTPHPVTPGMLLAFTTMPTVEPHATAGAAPDPLMVATEFAVDGRGIDDNYTNTGETVEYAIFQAGEIFYALLATGQNVAVGAKLTSNGDGTLKAKGTADTAFVQATEAVNNSAGSAPARIRVEVL